MPELKLRTLPDFPEIEQGDDLSQIIARGLVKANIELTDGDILVLAQKIVSKAEGRKVNLKQVLVSPAADQLSRKAAKDPRIVQLILEESTQVLRHRVGLIVVEHRLGFVCANAGIDHSNVAGDDEWVLLLPKDPDKTASQLQTAIQASHNVRIGVLIIDSHGRAWRMGTVGACIGVAGVPVLVDLRGKPDRMGRVLQRTEVGAADELAAAASLIMGQAAEGTPVVHVRGFPYDLRESGLEELIRPKEFDLFQ